MSFEEDDFDNITNNVRDETDEMLNLALKASLEESNQAQALDNHTNTNNNEDDQLKKAIEASLIENQKQNEELFNSVLYESLDTAEDDEKILVKAIEESHLSNISIRLNTEIINSGLSSNIDSIINMSSMSNMSNTESDLINPSHNEDYQDYQDYDDPIHDNDDPIHDNDDPIHDVDDVDEEEYMKMIIQQIKESEELENKLNINKKTKSIIEEQDFEYEEALRKDIEKEKEKVTISSVNNNNNNKIAKDTLNSDTITSKIIDEVELPKTKEELRKIRLAFYDRK